ncbi:hypothetical protein ACHWQZ_G011872 [Mnemiopsis leidyi]
MSFFQFQSILQLFIVCFTTSHEHTNKFVDKQPNIIFILSDDLGYSDVGFTNGFIETPNLNRLAREGVQLTQNYVQQVCTPTRGALMSGRYPIHTGLQHDVIYPGEPWGLPLDETIIPQILKEYNYSTHAVGKWHLGMHKWAYTSLYRGFDDFFGYYLGGQNYDTHRRDKGLDLRSDYFDRNGKFVDELRWDLDGRYSAELYSEHTVSLINSLKSRKEPFFIYLAYQSVHGPHMVPQRYIDQYSSHITNYDQKVFAAMVSSMDEGIGNITKALDESGLADNTIIVFSSDNGGHVNCLKEAGVTSSNYPYRGGKRALYEGGVMSPSFVWASNRLSSSRSDALIHVTDWLPTFWSLASLRGKLIPNNPIKTKPLDGLDQWLAISENIPSNRTEFLINIDPLPIKCGHQVSHAGIRWKEWKLIIGQGGPPSGWYPAPGVEDLVNYCGPHDSYIELYNIIDDPSETRNVSDKFPDIVQMLTDKIKAYNTTAVPMGNKKRDPASNPRNFNFTWMPWMDMADKVPDDVYKLSIETWLSGNQLTEDYATMASVEDICFEFDEDISSIDF